MEEVFATRAETKAFEQRALEVFATKEDLIDLVTKEDFTQFKNEILTNQDKIIRDLEILITEKTVGDYQERKRRELYGILIEALSQHKILSPDQLARIKKLGIS